MNNKFYFLPIFFIYFQTTTETPIQGLLDGQSILRNGIDQLQTNLNKKPDGFLLKINDFSNSIDKIKDFIIKIPDSIINQLHSSETQLTSLIDKYNKSLNSSINSLNSLKDKKLKLNKFKKINLDQQFSALEKKLNARRNLFISSITNNLIAYLTNKKNIVTDLQNEVSDEINIAKKYIQDFETAILSSLNKQGFNNVEAKKIKSVVQQNINQLNKDITQFYNNIKNYITTTISTFINYLNNLNNAFNDLGKKSIILIDNLIDISKGGSLIITGIKDFPIIPGLPATIIPTPLYSALSNSQGNLNDIQNILISVKQAGIPSSNDLAHYVLNLGESIVKGMYNSPIAIPYISASILTAVDAIEAHVKSLQGTIKELQTTADDLNNKFNGVKISGIISDIKSMLSNLADLLQNDINESLVFTIAVIESFKKHINVNLVSPAMQNILNQLKNLMTSLSSNLTNVRDNLELIGVSIGVEIGVMVAILTASIVGIAKLVSGIKKSYTYSEYVEKLKEELKELGFSDEQIKNVKIPDKATYTEVVNKYELALKSGKPAEMSQVINKMSEIFKIEPEKIFSALKENLPIELKNKLSNVYEESITVIEPPTTITQNLLDQARLSDISIRNQPLEINNPPEGSIEPYVEPVKTEPIDPFEEGIALVS